MNIWIWLFLAVGIVFVVALIAWARFMGEIKSMEEECSRQPDFPRWKKGA